MTRIEQVAKAQEAFDSALATWRYAGAVSKSQDLKLVNKVFKTLKALMEVEK